MTQGSETAPHYRNGPDDGPIDLEVHDLPHGSSATEWWYVNSHLEAVTGRRLSLFASFFRIIPEGDKETRKVEHVHMLAWAVSDADSGRYYPESRVDQCFPELCLDRLERNEWKTDPLLRRALVEVL
jgi:predicted secreted hydrolase